MAASVSATFVKSGASPADYPDDGLAELALVGRSNVGKSTLVNALTGIRLARTSRAAGKTRLLNVYRLQDGPSRPFHLVDLPGYGYARGGEKSQEEFEVLMREYFDSRTGATGTAGRRQPSAFAVLLLVDGRHPGLASDARAHDWLAGLGVPCEARYYRGGIHAFHALVWDPAARQCWRDALAFLDRHMRAR